MEELITRILSNQGQKLDLAIVLTEFDIPELKTIFTTLQRNISLTDLNLGHNGLLLSPEKFHLLLDFIEKTSTLRVLSLHGYVFNAAQLAQLCQTIAKNQSLHELNLDVTTAMRSSIPMQVIQASLDRNKNNFSLASFKQQQRQAYLKHHSPLRGSDMEKTQLQQAPRENEEVNRLNSENERLEDCINTWLRSLAPPHIRPS